MGKRITRKTMISLLRAVIDDPAIGSVIALAKLLDCSRQNIYDVLHGARTPGRKLLAEMGLRKIKPEVYYERIEE